MEVRVWKEGDHSSSLYQGIKNTYHIKKCIFMLLFSEHQHIVDINVILDNLKACHKVLARITSTNEKMYIKRLARMRTTRHGFGMYCL